MSKQADIILKAATECIAKSGYAEVSMRNIADEAGVALSQLNYYYKNKEGLFKEVIKKASNKYLREIEASLRIQTSPKEKAYSLIKYFKEVLEHEPDFFKLLYDFSGLALWSPTVKKELNNLFEDLSEMIEENILNNLHTEELKGYTQQSMSQLITGSMFGVGIQNLLNPKKNLSETVLIINMLFD